MELRKIDAVRYMQPLREGGSLPALIEGSDDFKYVLKFKGSGHGTKSLVSEYLGGMITQRIGLKIPEMVFVTIDEYFGRNEGDEEIQDLLKGSIGLNLGLQFLSPALTYEPSLLPVDDYLASQIVWLDAFTMNIDRTIKNTNLLIFHKELWVIDNGASFYFHHTWNNWEQTAKSKFPYIKDHVLLAQATRLEEVNEALLPLFTDEYIDKLVDSIPEVWLNWNTEDETVDDIRKVYKEFMKIRRNHANVFLKEADDARKKLY